MHRFGTARRGTTATLLLVAVLAVASLGGTALAADPGPAPRVDSGGAVEPRHGPPVPAALATAGLDPDDVNMGVSLAANGSAGWEISYRMRLETDNETAAFESLEADVRTNESAYLDPFAAGIQTTVDDAESATGREMAATDFDVATSVTTIPRRYGVVTYRFTWSGFAAVEGEELTAGDALAGFFLDAESTSLTVRWPAGYEATSVTPEPTERGDRSVTWTGPLTFGPDGPTVAIAPAGGSTVPLSVVAGAGVVLLLVVAGAWRYVLGSRDADTNGAVEPGPQSNEVEADDSDASADPPSAAETEAGTETGTDAGSDADGHPDEDDGTEEPPADLLSNEERVLRLLRERGGRLKQQTVVQELDWTAAKTSQVVGKMRDEGTIEGFRLGRENVLRLPETDESGGEE